MQEEGSIFKMADSGDGLSFQIEALHRLFGLPFNMYARAKRVYSSAGAKEVVLHDIKYTIQEAMDVV